MFYINYEECKLIEFVKVHKKETSFILTMRNVNEGGSINDGIIDGGFILTMRNVNLLFLTLTCLVIYRFILTMRNVNQVYGHIDNYLAKSFILTMRNVNVYASKDGVVTVRFYINYEECKL